MEFETIESYENFMNNCRLCLQPFDIDSEFFFINELSRKCFQSITNYELDDDASLYSERICRQCNNDLRYCVAFKDKIMDTQKTLQEQAKIFLSSEIKIEYEEVPVKLEIEQLEIEEEEVLENQDYTEEFELIENEEIDMAASDSELQNATESEKVDVIEMTVSDSELLNTTEGLSESFEDSQLENLSPNKKSSSRNRKAENERRNQKKCCQYCNKWITGYRLKAHIESVHEKIKRFTCDHCGKMFYHKRTLHDHLKSKFGIKNFECEYCGKMTSSAGARLNHIYTFHQKKYERYCDLCGERFSCKLKFDTHMIAKHTNLRPYQCDVDGCNKTFCSKASVYEHKKRAHAPDVECPVCSKVCSSKIALRHHIKIHRERKFVCTFEENGVRCDKTFVNANPLKIHMNIHYGVKNYVCQECGMAYAKPKYLRSHMLNIHQKMKIKCELCSSLMSSKEYYRKHVILHHKELDEETRNDFLAKLKKTKESDLFQQQN